MTNNSFSEIDITETVSQILNKTWENISLPLTDWQKQSLDSWQNSSIGLQCLLKSWYLINPGLAPGTYCNATWDGFYCWPPIEAGTTINRTCTQAFQETWPYYAPFLKGTAFRVCGNGTWLRGNWTNYTECADSYDSLFAETTTGAPAAPPKSEESELVEQVQVILFVGSIISLICLITAIATFCCFRSLWCDRVIVHIHLMAALVLRYVLLIIISEPFVLGRTTNYRNKDWTCKAVLIAHLYATVTSTNWMLIQGIYLNSKLTTNIFEEDAPFKLYCTFGWLFPAVLLAGYSTLMQYNHKAYCWKGYGDRNELWIVLGPVLFALLINVVMLLNILNILINKIRSPRQQQPSDANKMFRRAAKATLILSPILGINNLLFVYNPGGVFHKYYVTLNTLFSATQGIFVAIIYCYMNKEVQYAVRRWPARFKARRDSQRRNLRRRNSQSYSSGMVVERPVRIVRNGTTGTRPPLIATEPEDARSTLVSTVRAYAVPLQDHPVYNEINQLYPLIPSPEPQLSPTETYAWLGRHAVFLSGRQ